LITEAVAPHSAIAQAVCPQGRDAVGPIIYFLTKSLKIAFGFSASPYVLNKHQISLLGIPTGMGINNC
jgi:hypothetical protein